MGRANFQHILLGLLALLSAFWVNAEDPYRFYTFSVTYGTIYPLGKAQQGILINGQFPGPTIECVTNDNIIVNVFNNLDEPFLITWNGIKQRRTSWQDGVLGTNCPIPSKSNFTYKFQAKDQIGTYSYFPSTFLHRAVGGFGGFNIVQRSVISIPYPTPDGEFTLLINDWYKAGHKALQQTLDLGKNPLPPPDALLVNGLHNSASFTGKPGKTYKLRISNMGIETSINFRIQGHVMKLIEVEGAHTLQEMYESLDIHPGQCMAVLVTLSGSTKDYFIVASSRFTKPIFNTTAVLHYAGSSTPAAGPLPFGPTYHVHWSMKQARTIRLNLTANAARPNPQGSFHYGNITVVRTLILANSETVINGKLRYAVNGVSYVDPATPLKLADYYNISGVFNLNTFKDPPMLGQAFLGASVVNIILHDFVEIIFLNNENTTQSWHLDGSSFYVVGFGFLVDDLQGYKSGYPVWKRDIRMRYNLADAVARHTVQVYRRSWTAVLVSLDNKGMWNLRSAIWSRRYLGQQLYLRVWSDEMSVFTESDIPQNALHCGKAVRT